MGSKLNVLVLPLGGAKLTRDEAHPMDPVEVSVDECVPGFGVVVGAVSETQIPVAIFLPRVFLEEGVFGISVRLDSHPNRFSRRTGGRRSVVGREQPRAY